MTRGGFRQPGDQIEVVFDTFGRPSLVMPATVLEDGPERIVHRLAAGTVYLRRQQLNGLPMPRVSDRDGFYAVESKLVAETWSSNNQYIVVFPDRGASFRCKYDAESGDLTGFYVNLQEPLMRTSYGFWTIDQYLDIRVQPDLTWEIKDQDEFDAAVTSGIMPAEVAGRVRDEAARVIDDIAARRFPFDGFQPTWDAAPQFPIATLQSRWRGR